MKIIGRNKAKDTLSVSLSSKRPEFIVVFGRRRVGKTFLIREFFNHQFSFYATGMTAQKTSGQLKAFHESLIEYGSIEKTAPKDWFEAFARLRELLSSPDAYRDPVSGRLVVFLDEMPWMDTPRSDFRSALEYFWNKWGSAQEDFALIVCGSATSWIINNLLKDRKGFHNRITRRILLSPFTLKECEELFDNNGIVMTRQQIMECYMVFGGIPFYLNLLDSRLSLSQNIEELCFKPYGELHDEYRELFYSLFKKPEKHLAIIKALSATKGGKTRSMLASVKEIGGGAALTKDLDELEQCGFIRRYSDYKTVKNGACYQLTDPFVLFYLRFMEKPDNMTWMEYIHSPGYNAWRGHAFEILCINHIPQLKKALGIAGVETREYSWKSKRPEGGAQIDLLIDRKDGIIHLCEMKYTDNTYETDKAEYEKLLNRMSVFQKETMVKKAVHITIISANGVKRNKYYSVYQSEIDGDSLFG